jgi:hypothetical protein
MQTWPLLKPMLSAQAGTASSRLASSKMRVGLLPPSSRVTFFKFELAAEVMTIGGGSVFTAASKKCATDQLGQCAWSR